MCDAGVTPDRRHQQLEGARLEGEPRLSPEHRRSGHVHDEIADPVALGIAPGLLDGPGSHVHKLSPRANRRHRSERRSVLDLS